MVFRLFRHNALSLNAIIANRASGTFSADPYKAVDELIGYTLDRLKLVLLICSNYPICSFKSPLNF
jgi:hypothetical protein